MSAETAGGVLLVEDDTDVREAVADTLQDAGIQVFEARHGLEALELLRQGGVRPCVILLDLMMPVMDGWQFREEQLKDSAIAAIPVVALSAHGNLTELAAAGHLRKPVQLSALLEAIARFCPTPA